MQNNRQPGWGEVLVSELGRSASCWLDDPDGAVFAVRRQRFDGARIQWAVIERDGALEVWRSKDGVWRVLGGRFVGLPEIRDTYQEVFQVHPDEISDFCLKDGTRVAKDSFLAMLDLCTEEGDDDPERRPDDAFRQFSWEYDLYWALERQFPVVRTAGLRGGQVIVGVEYNDRIVAGLVGEDMDHLIRVNVESRDFLVWDAGYALCSLGQRLGLSVPLGDFKETDRSCEVIELPYGERELADALARWTIEKRFGMWAALFLEPLDPDGALDSEDRQEWEEILKPPFFGNWTPDFAWDNDHKEALRESLSRNSPQYAWMKEALAAPLGELGQELREELVEGDAPILDW